MGLFVVSAILLVILVAIGLILYVDKLATESRRVEEQRRILRAQNNKRLYEESVRRTLARSSSSRSAVSASTRDISANNQTSASQSDSSLATVAAFAILDDAGSSSSDCGSSYDAGSSSSDCGGNSGD